MTALGAHPGAERPWPGADAWSDESSREVLRFVAGHCSEMTGFRHAVVNVADGSGYRVVAVSDDSAALAALIDSHTEEAVLGAGLGRAEHWGRRLSFVPGSEVDDPPGAWVVPDIPAPTEPDDWHPLNMLLAVLHDSGGRRIGFLSIDVPADLKRPGRDRWTLLDRYAEHVEAVVRLATERETLKHLEADRAVDVRAIGHEITNPLTVLEGHLDLLMLGDHTVEQRSSYDAMSRATRRLRRLTADLHDTAERTAPAVAVAPTLARLLSQVVGDRDRRQHRPDVVVRLHAPEHDLQLAGRAEDLDLVVGNLVDNAVKYSADGGVVDVSHHADGAHAVIEVTDAGLGISPDDQERVFTDRFRSTNPEALQRPGSGLGLGIVRRLVERVGGTVQVRSELGVGSTFTVRWPTR